MSQADSPPGASPFQPGLAVRVRAGTRDPDFPDAVLDGWTGVVRDWDGDAEAPVCLVAWDAATLAGMPPAVRQRAEAEGLELESMWLAQADLEPVPDPAPAAEAPATLPFPVPPDDRTQRIRAILGLAPEGPMPPVTRRSLQAYHRYLKRRLTFPLSGEHLEADPAPLRCTLVGLRPVREAPVWAGLLGDLRLDGEPFGLSLAAFRPDDALARDLLDDYVAWFEAGTAAKRERQARLEEEIARELAAPSLLRILVLAGGSGAVAAAPLGALLLTVEATRTGLWVGAAILGVLGGVLGHNFGDPLSRGGEGPASAPASPLAGGVLGALVGALAGGVLGVALVAYAGTLLGAIAGSLVGYGAARLGWRPFGGLVWAPLGALVGDLALALLTDWERGLVGAAGGLLVGGVGAILLLLLVGLSGVEGPPGDG